MKFEGFVVSFEEYAPSKSMFLNVLKCELKFNALYSRFAIRHELLENSMEHPHDLEDHSEEGTDERHLRAGCILFFVPGMHPALADRAHQFRSTIGHMGFYRFSLI